MSEETNHYASFDEATLAAVSVVGRVRLNNEDAIGHWLPPDPGANALRGMLVVADGMGGHEAGEVASQLVITQWQDYISRLNEHTLTQSQIEPSLRYGVENLHRQVREQAQATNKMGMGTTLVSALLYQSQIWIANVGDSPAYLFRNGELQTVFQTDNEVEHLLQEGLLDIDTAQASPFRNRLLQAIGADTLLEVHLQKHPAHSGDRLVLCSDGLTAHVRHDEIAHALRQLSNNHEAAAHLVQLANDRGGKDNISVVLATVCGGLAPSAAPPKRLVPVSQRLLLYYRWSLFLLGGLLILGGSYLIRNWYGAPPKPLPSMSHIDIGDSSSSPLHFYLRFVEGHFEIETQPALLWQQGNILELGRQVYQGRAWKPPETTKDVTEEQSLKLVHRTGFYEIEVSPPTQLFVNGRPYSDEIKSFFTVAEGAVNRLGIYLDKEKTVNFSIVTPAVLFQAQKKEDGE